MATQSERQNYNWRPNDNSSTTRLRYDLEAEHWFLAYQGAKRKHTRASFQETAGVIGLVLSLIFNLIWLMGLIVVKFFKWVSK